MMIRQLNRVVEYLECLPVNIINMENTEADDVIGYLSKDLEDMFSKKTKPQYYLLIKILFN